MVLLLMSSQNQRQKLHRHHELHLHFALPPPPYPLSRVTLAHCKHYLSCGGGGDAVLAVHQHPHSFSLTALEKDRVCHSAICNQYPRLHRQEAMENEGAMGLTHRSCFRVAAAPTLATKRRYDSQDHLGRSPVFEGKKTGEKGGCQVAQGALVVGMRNTYHYQCT